MKIEFILRESTIRDILKPWVDTGHTDNSGDGGFCFDNVHDYDITNGVIHITINDDDANEYIYNISDFYRIKISF